MKTPPILETILADGYPIASMFLAMGYFYLKPARGWPAGGLPAVSIRMRFDKTTQEWVDFDPRTLRTEDYRRICRELYIQGDVRITEIAPFVKLTVQATNGHASGAGNIGHAKKSA